MAVHHEPSATHHVMDQDRWQFFERIFGDQVELTLPSFTLFGHEFHLTKFMLLELIAAALILAIFIPIARKASTGALPRGRWWNAFEVLLTFVRNNIARPNLGEHEADKYVPFLWTQFLFILFCNLLGMIPFMGSPTASIWVTGGLALISFVLMNGAPIAKVGVKGFFASLWPKIDMPPGRHFDIMGMIFTVGIGMIEILGIFIRSGVLAVRLFANMFAGHLVLAYILFFIYMARNVNFLLWGTITVASILGCVGLSLLELFVAFLQAYIFTFLTALFMGMSIQHAEAH